MMKRSSKLRDVTAWTTAIFMTADAPPGADHGGSSTKASYSGLGMAHPYSFFQIADGQPNVSALTNGI